MKEREESRSFQLSHRPIHRIVRPLTALVLVFCLLAVLYPAGVKALAVDLSQPCSLTVVPGSSDLIQDLTEAGVVIDLYWVADAVEGKSDDAYTYQMKDIYGELAVSDSPNNAEWRSLSQKAASIALGENGDTPVVTGAASDKAITKTDVGGNLSAGLYLVVARGQGLKNYMTTITNESGQKQIATVAYSQKYIYTFAPELVSLPGKQADDKGSVNTANPGEWIYDMSITLKPEQDVRHGSLEIVKTLLSYETSDPAVFVFSVEAVLNGENVYSDVVTLDFTEAGQKSVVIDGIPVGAQVTVTEIYSGASYSLTTDETQTVVIPADGVESVSFTNDYNGSRNHGSGITNYFEYNGVTGWNWRQIPADEE